MICPTEKKDSNVLARVVDILGMPVNAVTMDDVVNLADRSITCGKRLVLGMLNAAKLVNCRKDPALRQSLLQADIIVADGVPIVWLSKLTGKPLPQRVAGIDIMYNLLRLSNEKGYGVYLLGARPAVVEKASRWAQRSYPHLRIAGFRDGYFSPAQEEEVACQIKKSDPDILFVAMTSPKKENFLKKWHMVMGVPVCHGVGGSFDVVAGVTKRAPAWMQKLGLEWLFRVIQEPRRMWKRYLLTNTVFIKLSVLAILKAHLSALHRFVLKPVKDTRQTQSLSEK